MTKCPGVLDENSAASTAILTPLIANKMGTASKAEQVLSAIKDTSPAYKAVPNQQKNAYPSPVSQAEQRGIAEIDEPGEIVSQPTHSEKVERENKADACRCF